MTDRSINIAGLPSIITSTPSTILKRGARRVPFQSSDAGGAAGAGSSTATAGSPGRRGDTRE
jgi:hypothetical protein